MLNSNFYHYFVIIDLINYDYKPIIHNFVIIKVPLNSRLCL